MPFYEYVCDGCTHKFEELVLSGGPAPRCPECEGEALTRVPSTFAVGRAGLRVSKVETPILGGGSCGTCGDPRGPGACATD